MGMALEEARFAGEEGEVPVGAVIVHPDRGIVARARTQKESLNDPTAHAEVLAIGQAAEALGDWRLQGATLYSTLEPCPMCAGAILQARVSRVIYGATDPKGGAVESVVELFRPGLFNHNVEWLSGVLEDECGEVLRRFFGKRRRPGDPNP